MLTIDNLEKFCEAFKTKQTAIKKVLILADETDYNKFVKSENHTKDQAILVAILPSAGVDYKDEDNFKFKNFLHFIIMQKDDGKDSYESFLTTMKFTQPLMVALFDFMLNKFGSFNECMFNDFDMAQASIDPVTNFQRTNGYEMSVPLNTKMN